MNKIKIIKTLLICLLFLTSLNFSKKIQSQNFMSNEMEMDMGTDMNMEMEEGQDAIGKIKIKTKTLIFKYKI